MNDQPEYAFKGVWIPKEIWESDLITWMEKCLLADVDALDDGSERACFASNEYFAKKFGSSAASIANQISKLRKLGFVETVGFDGRERNLRLTSRLTQGKPISEGRVNQAVNAPIREGKAEILRAAAAPPQEESEPSIKSKVSERGTAFATWFKTTLPSDYKPKGNWVLNWAKCFDDMIRIDGRSESDIAKVCQWARKDDFWATNCMSPLKLRERNSSGVMYFDVLKAKTNEKKTTHPNSSGSSGRNEGTFNANGSAKFAGVEKLA